MSDVSSEGGDSSTNPYLPPESKLLKGPQLTFEGAELASRWQRLFANLFDTLIHVPFSIAILMVFAYVMNSDPKMAWYRYFDIPTIYYALMLSVIFIALNARLLSTRGQTVGKYLTKTRIVTRDNQIMDFKSILIFRFVPLWLFPLIPIIGAPFTIIDCLMIFSVDKRCLHDHIAGTKVIKVIKVIGDS